MLAIAIATLFDNRRLAGLSVPSPPHTGGAICAVCASTTSCSCQLALWSLVCLRIVVPDDSGGVAGNHAVRRHILQDNGIGSHHNVLSKLNPRSNQAIHAQERTLSYADRKGLRDRSSKDGKADVVVIMVVINNDSPGRDRDVFFHRNQACRGDLYAIP